MVKDDKLIESMEIPLAWCDDMLVSYLSFFIYFPGSIRAEWTGSRWSEL